MSKTSNPTKVRTLSPDENTELKRALVLGILMYNVPQPDVVRDLIFEFAKIVAGRESFSEQHFCGIYKFFENVQSLFSPIHWKELDEKLKNALMKKLFMEIHKESNAKISSIILKIMRSLNIPNVELPSQYLCNIIVIFYVFNIFSRP
jgi:hypothetical protein